MSREKAPDRMRLRVYLSSHQGHELARSGRGWRVALPASCFCQTTSVLTWRTFAAFHRTSLEISGWDSALPRPGQTVQTWAARGLVYPSDAFPSPSPRFRVTNKNTPGALWFSCGPAVQEIGCLPRNYPVLEMQRTLAGSLHGWKFGTFSSESGSITSPVTLGP